MEIDKLYSNKKKVNKLIDFYTKKGVIKRPSYATALKKAHLDKAFHNYEFVSEVSNRFNDWRVVGLYYSIYQAAQALISSKGYVCKNHTATLILLIAEFSDKITIEEIKLIDSMNITQEDAKLYVSLKEKRSQASYSTNVLFSDKELDAYSKDVISFLNKVEYIMSQMK